METPEMIAERKDTLMSQNINLKEIKRRAFRSVHQDGLWDIYIGGLFLVLSMMFAIPDSGEGELITIGLALLGVAIMFAMFQLGKKYITTPRMGQVQFGSMRQKRRITLGWIMGAFVLVTLGMFLFSSYMWNSSASGHANGVPVSLSTERMFVASLAALIAGASMAVFSYFKEFMRGYYIALLMAAGFFFTLVFDTTTPMINTGVLILVPGLVLFTNFLRRHPLSAQEASHGNS